MDMKDEFLNALKSVFEIPSGVFSSFQNYYFEVADKSHPIHSFISNKLFYSVTNLIVWEKCAVPVYMPETGNVEPKMSSTKLQETANSPDLTGSPLKCPFKMTVTVDSFNSTSEISENTVLKSGRCPTTLQNARLLLSKYSIFEKELNEILKSRPTAMWVVCNGEDKNKTLLMGIYKNKETVLRTSVTYSCKFELKNFDELKELALKNLPHAKLKCKGYAKYDLAPEYSNFNKIKCGILIESVWNDVDKLFEVPKDNATHSVIFIVNPGNQSSEVYLNFLEVSLVQEFVGGIEKSQVLWKLQNPVEAPVPERLAALLESLKISATKSASVNRSQMDKADFSVKNILNIIVEEKRKDIDFVDKLWKVLRDCSSLNELKECLTLVFTYALSGEMKPLVSKPNTLLAKVLNDIQHGKIEEMPDLDGLIPLEMLAQIGIEKIKRDYINAFVATGVVTQYDVAYFIEPNLSIREACSRLSKLHCAIEVLALCKSFINVQQVVISTYLKKVLLELQGLDDNKISYKFKFPLERSVALENIVKFSPIVWRLDLTAVHEKYTHCTVLESSVNLPQHFSQIGVTIEQPDTNVTNNFKYFTVKTEIEDEIY